MGNCPLPCLIAGGYFVVGEPSTDQVHFGILRNDMAVGSFCLALQTSPLHSDLTEQHQHHCKFCLVIKEIHPRMTKHFRVVSYRLPMSIYIDHGRKESKHSWMMFKWLSLSPWSFKDFRLHQPGMWYVECTWYLSESRSEFQSGFVWKCWVNIPNEIAI